MRGAKDPSLANLPSQPSQHTHNNSKSKETGTQRGYRKSFPTCSNLNYKIQNCFPESKNNAYIPSIQRLLSLFSLSTITRLQESYLKDLPYSFSLGGYATALNCLHNHPPPRWWSVEKPPACISISISSALAHCQSMQLTNLITGCPS